MTKKKDKNTSAEEVTDGIQKLVQGNVQEPIVLDQEEEEQEPQGPNIEDIDDDEALPKLEVVEGEVIEKKGEDPAAIAHLSRPPFEQKAREEQKPHDFVDQLKNSIFKKHSDRGTLAVSFANSILQVQGLRGNSSQIVRRSFEIADDIQAEIDRCYNEERIRRIPGQQ